MLPAVVKELPQPQTPGRENTSNIKEVQDQIHKVNQRDKNDDNAENSGSDKITANGEKLFHNLLP